MKQKFIFPFLLLTVSLTSCRNTTYIKNLYVFDTSFFTIKLFEGTNADLDNLSNIVLNLDKEFDAYKHYDELNNIYDINHASDYIEVSNDIISILNLSNQMKEETNGYFNPLIGNLSNLWKTSLNNNVIPSSEDIQTRIAEMNNSSLSISGNMVKINGDATIDLGAVAKGYTLGRIKEYLISHSITHYLIDGGRSSLLLGEKNAGDGFFNVGIDQIDNGYFQSKNCAYGTSSIFEQEVTIDDQTYSHIINPFTGEAKTEQDMVVLIGSDPAILDILSTTLTLLPVTSFPEYENTYSLKILAMKDSEVVYQTNGLEVMYH